MSPPRSCSRPPEKDRVPAQSRATADRSREASALQLSSRREGAEQIARSLVRLAGRLCNLTILERSVNGQPGLAVQRNGVTVTVVAFQVESDQIKHIWAIRNPNKLRSWTAGPQR